MKKLKNRIGMTMAEVLLVVGIISILLGVAFIAVWNYQRSLGQLERDGIAKEIFVAAQNHLTAAYGAGYWGLKEPEETSSDPNPFGTKDTEGAHYFVVNGDIAENSALGQMLPFGSIDETVRMGGSYIIRYQKDAGLVLDVFYCTRSGSPAQFNHDLSGGESGDYDAVCDLRDTAENSYKDKRRDWNGHILGWYGGDQVAELATTTMQTPAIAVYNKEKLYVEVTDPNKDNTNALLNLIIVGEDSNAKKAYVLSSKDTNDTRVKKRTDSSGKVIYTVVLDDVTTQSMHFGDIKADTADTTGEKFIPGENIIVQAVAYSTTALTNIAYSSKSTTNSLFGSINKTSGSSINNRAYIGNIRHLENLDKGISKLDNYDIGIGDNEKLNIQYAEQTDSFSWPGFQKAVKSIEAKNDNSIIPENTYNAVGIYNIDGSSTLISGVGYYRPIEPAYALTYDGKNHSISDVAVNVASETTGDAGLFGKVEAGTVSAISNLELIDFSIKGNNSAGALVGTLNGCTVTNVIARNKDKTTALSHKITAKTHAGGLIGNLSGGTVMYSAASVLVGDTSNRPEHAGGLIGSVIAKGDDSLKGDDSFDIVGCYSGGHTTSGSYKEWVRSNPYDVYGVTAGGFVGTSTANISNSYSTCSVSGSTEAGGFAGRADGKIENSYATGYIDPDSNATAKYAFIAAGSAELSKNLYYRVINEVKEGAKEDETEPMPPFPGAEELSSSDVLAKTRPLDLNADTYNTFVGKWDDWNLARAFDPALVQYYSGRYTLRAVNEPVKKELTGAEKDFEPVWPTGYENWNQLYVMVHYGDWPSPEVFFINKSGN